MSSLKEIEASISAARADIALEQALDRLILNRDFKEVVQQGYIEKLSVALVLKKAGPDSRAEETQRRIGTQLDAIGFFYQYLQEIREKASIARKVLNDAEIALDEIRAES